MARTDMFFPKSFGLNKEEVIEMVADRLLDSPGLATDLLPFNQQQQVAALTDQRMQQFVNEWYQPVYEYIGEEIVSPSVQEKMREALTSLIVDLRDTLVANQPICN